MMRSSSEIKSTLVRDLELYNVMALHSLQVSDLL